MTTNFPGKPAPLTTKPKESRVVTIERFETFLYELHRALRRLPFAAEDYPELNKFLEKHTK